MRVCMEEVSFYYAVHNLFLLAKACEKFASDQALRFPSPLTTG